MTIKTTITMSIDTRKLDELIREYPRAVDAIIDKAAISIQGRAIQNTHTFGGSNRDTGAMIGGWVTNLNTGGKGSDRIPLPDQDFQAVVGNEVEYALFWELGHGNFAPEPALGDAVEAERQPFERAWKGLLA